MFSYCDTCSSCSEVPSFADHLFEVVIAVNGDGYVRVVLKELGEGQCTVTRVTVLRTLLRWVTYEERVVLLKAVQELVEDIFLSFFATSHVRVHRTIVGSFKIFDVHSAVSIAIKSLERLINESLAAIIHFSNNLSKELIVVDGSLAVPIKQVEDSGNLGYISWENTVVLHGLTKLSKGEGL